LHARIGKIERLLVSALKGWSFDKREHIHRVPQSVWLFKGAGIESDSGVLAIVSFIFSDYETTKGFEIGEIGEMLSGSVESLKAFWWTNGERLELIPDCR